MAKKQAKRKTTRSGASRGGSRRTGAAKRAGGRKTAVKKTSRTARGATKKKAARKRTTSTARTQTRAMAGSARRRPGGGAAARGRSTGRGVRVPRGGAQLSASTRSAVWIETPDDLEQQPGETLATRSHEVIQRWAEERGAEPATVAGGDPAEPRVLRFNFPGFGGESLQAVSWDDWFQTFDDRNLVFLFQERLKNGNQSNFFRLDNPDREDA